MGRGTGTPHRAGGISMIPIIGVDYFYITSGGGVSRGEVAYATDASGEAGLEVDRKKGVIVKCLLIRCMNTKNVFAHVVPQNGRDESRFVVSLVMEDIKWLGHTKLIIKADNENALQAMIEGAL